MSSPELLELLHQTRVSLEISKSKIRSFQETKKIEKIRPVKETNEYLEKMHENENNLMTHLDRLLNSANRKKLTLDIEKLKCEIVRNDEILTKQMIIEEKNINSCMDQSGNTDINEENIEKFQTILDNAIKNIEKIKNGKKLLIEGCKFVKDYNSMNSKMVDASISMRSETTEAFKTMELQFADFISEMNKMKDDILKNISNL
jgi:hypothetical protein